MTNDRSSDSKNSPQQRLTLEDLEIRSDPSTIADELFGISHATSPAHPDPNSTLSLREQLGAVNRDQAAPASDIGTASDQDEARMQLTIGGCKLEVPANFNEAALRRLVTVLASIAALGVGTAPAAASLPETPTAAVTSPASFGEAELFGPLRATEGTVVAPKPIRVAGPRRDIGSRNQRLLGPRRDIGSRNQRILGPRRDIGVRSPRMMGPRRDIGRR